MRVAFASYDNVRVDQHFGSARYWQIYDVDTESIFVETRKVSVLYQEQSSHEERFKSLLTLLGDCEAIFVVQIGEVAVEYMIHHNKRVFEATGEIPKIIEELIKSQLLSE